MILHCNILNKYLLFKSYDIKNVHANFWMHLNDSTYNNILFKQVI